MARRKSSPPRRRGPRSGLNQRCQGVYAVMQINPIRVQCFNDSEFPGAVPFLDLLLTSYRVLHEAMMFVPYKYFQIIGFGKTLIPTIFMLPYAVPKRAGDANIHRAAIKIRNDVNGWPLLFTHQHKQTWCFTPVNQSGAPAFAGVTEQFEGSVQ